MPPARRGAPSWSASSKGTRGGSRWRCTLTGPLRLRLDRARGYAEYPAAALRMIAGPDSLRRCARRAASCTRHEPPRSSSPSSRGPDAVRADLERLPRAPAAAGGRRAGAGATPRRWWTRVVGALHLRRRVARRGPALADHPEGAHLSRRPAAIVAAADTSLPEDLGGERNWDYRYCWLRDATFTLHALLAAGYTEEAQAWREWLLRAVAGDPARLQIMYGIAGERRLTEFEPGLAARLRGLRPGAGRQRRVRASSSSTSTARSSTSLHLADGGGRSCRRRLWQQLRELVELPGEHLAGPDDGIWEMRGPRRHFVHSKVMAWVAFDRAITRRRAIPRSRARSSAGAPLATAIHEEVCERGLRPQRNTFTQSYGCRRSTPALLLIRRSASCRRRPAGDRHRRGDRARAVDRRRLRAALPTDSQRRRPARHEGAFLACSFWLADASRSSAGAARRGELFERLLALRNDVGLLAEEYDPRRKRQLGNFPQAFSHLALVSAARVLSGERIGTRSAPPEPLPRMPMPSRPARGHTEATIAICPAASCPLSSPLACFMTAGGAARRGRRAWADGTPALHPDTPDPEHWPCAPGTRLTPRLSTGIFRAADETLSSSARSVNISRQVGALVGGWPLIRWPRSSWVSSSASRLARPTA